MWYWGKSKVLSPMDDRHNCYLYKLNTASCINKYYTSLLMRRTNLSYNHRAPGAGTMHIYKSALNLPSFFLADNLSCDC